MTIKNWIDTSNPIFNRRGVRADVMCSEGDEVYRAVTLKAIATIVSEKRITRDEAIRLLAESTIDNPVKCSDCEFWVE